MKWIVIGMIAIVLVFLGWGIYSIKKIRAGNRGILLKFGKAVAVKDDGIYFYPKGIYEWVIYPLEMYVLKYTNIPVVTKKGEYGGPLLGDYKKKFIELEQVKKEKGEKSKEFEAKKKEIADFKEKYKAQAERYERAEIRVDAAVYFRWPKEGKDLIDSLKYGPSPGSPANPKDLERITGFFKDAIEGYIREIGGDMTWGEVIENRERFAELLKKKLNEEGSPFEVARIKDFHGVISGIELPKELREVITKPQEERLKADAAKEVAKKLKAEIGEGIGEAAKALEEIYNFPRDKAQDAAIERHGDILAAREGELKRIHWKDGSERLGGSGGINPKTIAQAIVVAQEMLGSRIPLGRPAEPSKETEKKEKEIDEMSIEEQERTIMKWAKEEEEELRKK